MDRVFSSHIRVILCQRGTDELEMRPFKPDIGFSALFIRVQAEVPGVHIERLADLSGKGIWSLETVCRKNAHELADFSGHDLQPGHIFSGLFVVNDMRSVHTVGRM